MYFFLHFHLVGGILYRSLLWIRCFSNFNKIPCYNCTCVACQEWTAQTLPQIVAQELNQPPPSQGSNPRKRLWTLLIRLLVSLNVIPSWLVRTGPQSNPTRVWSECNLPEIYLGEIELAQEAVPGQLRSHSLLTPEQLPPIREDFADIHQIAKKADRPEVRRISAYLLGTVSIYCALYLLSGRRPLVSSPHRGSAWCRGRSYLNERDYA